MFRQIYVLWCWIFGWEVQIHVMSCGVVAYMMYTDRRQLTESWNILLEQIHTWFQRFIDIRYNGNIISMVEMFFCRLGIIVRKTHI
jgi:hypothetical protein